ncbi:dipeptidase [Pendulispora rubella]|uniref:Dipeptidase n=1 Tax=Pendulispora rubella TaxID=2741070 RepID=A0ABZ2KWC9_9BACT
MTVSDEAKAVHSAYPAVDLHADTLMWTRWLGYDLHARHTPPLPLAAFGGHVDIPRMREGGMSAQFFGLVSLPLREKGAGLGRAVDEQIDALHEAIDRRPGALRLVKHADEIRACDREGRISALLGIEGAHALEGDLDRIDHFARRGVRYLGLLHFSANEAGFPAYGRGRRDTRGLTAWGRELVGRCEAASVLVDLAHINRQGFLDVCEMATRPPIVSHTGVLGAFEHWRNIGDDQLRAVADKGGCVGVIFCPRYVGGDGLGPVVKHLLHILDVVGEDVPALGSDWDGFIVPTSPLKDPTGLPRLTEALLAAKVPERVIGKILRQNVLRVLADA